MIETSDGDMTFRRNAAAHLDAMLALCETVSCRRSQLLAYFGQLCGLSRHEARARSTALLDRVGLGAERRLAVRRYSKGMVQRLGVAQALVHDPDLVVDEDRTNAFAQPLGE